MKEDKLITKDDRWPILAEEALYGLAGDIVRTIDPYTEADPVAVLANILTTFGNCIGPRAHFRIEHTLHYLRLFTVLVGKSAVGRKGQSLSTVKHMLSEIDPEWAQQRITGGLSSGEVLINEVRDERREKKPTREGGATRYEEIIVDHVFVNPDGTPILPDHVRKKLLPSACKKADVINITPHGFRHTYAANYMMGGGNIWDLSKVLGHSSVKLTEDYYAHFSKEHVLKRARIITHEGNVISANFGVRGG